jgi:hypothetical protein
VTTTPSLPAARPSLALGTLGALAIVVSWFQAAGRLRVGDQADWAVVGVAGTTAVVLASLLWVLAARRAVERRLGHVLTRLEPNAALTPELAVERTTREALVASPVMAHYHRAGCPLALGKPVSPAARGVHDTAGRRPCGVCRP